MVDSCRIFTYSPNNRYARDYYNACENFDNIRNKVINYERSNDDRTSEEYLAMMKEFKYWDAQVPETSNKAGEEEEKLQEKNKNSLAFSTSPFHDENGRLDYLS